MTSYKKILAALLTGCFFLCGCENDENEVKNLNKKTLGVEEAKSIGKNMILSDIGVHKEQNPKLAAYFDPYDEVSLATLMEEIWLNGVKNNDLSDQQLENDLITRTKEFGLNYYNILKNVVQ